MKYPKIKIQERIIGQQGDRNSFCPPFLWLIDEKGRTQGMKQERELELLAPAGSLATLKAVISAGADAVYVGGAMFGARAYAQNFNREELLEAIDYGHLHSRKVILAVNTLLKNKELSQQLYDYLLPYYEAGLDAVIVQDFGVMHFIRTHFPKLPIHTSTQMTVAGVGGAKLLASLGASRIVTARELSLAEISAIHAAVDVEIESFIHGALCYCYSGQCLLSSILGGRSGNRGRCAQPCRLAYEVYDKERKLLNPGTPYILSLKDLNTLEFLPEIAESGVYSFKIEGRMKSTQYAKGVVSVYRRYMDRYLEYGKEGYRVTKEDERLLFDFGNRNGFTKGYYFQRNGADMLTGKTSAHSKAEAADSQQEMDSVNELKEKIHGKLTILSGKPAMLRVWKDDCVAEVTGDVAQEALKRPIERETVLEKLNKTGNTPFVFAEVDLKLDDGVFLPMTSINHMRKEALELLQLKLLKPYRRKQRAVVFEESTAFAAYQREMAERKEQKPDMIVSTESREGFLEALKREWVTDIYLDSICYTREELLIQLERDISQAKEAGKRVFYLMPPVFRADTRAFYERILSKLLSLPLDGFVLRSYDELGFFAEYCSETVTLRLDAGMYTYSDEAKSAFVRDTGIFRDTVPVELNKGELSHRKNNMSELLVYGRLPLMISAGCVCKNTLGCKKQTMLLSLRDRYGVEFPVRNFCEECCNIIYNAKPLLLMQFAEELRQMHPAAYRIHFTTETGREITSVLDYAKDTLVLGKKRNPSECVLDYTNGHYKRGVE